MQKNYATIDELPVPNTFDTECKCLAALVDNPEYIPEAKKNLNKTFFAHPENAAIWETLCDLESKGERIDMQTIYSRTNSGHYQQFILPHNIGTLPITEMYDTLNNLWNMSVKRKAYFTGLQMMQSSCNPVDGGNTPLDYATQYVEEMKTMLQTNPSVIVADAINEYAEELSKREELRKEGRPMKVLTSFPTLDQLTYGGFANGNLAILAARPSVGKAQPLNSTVLTPSGFRRIGDIKVGDEVMGRNGKPQKVLGVFPQGKRPTYKVTMTDGCSVLCDEEHIWTVTDVTSSKRVEHELTVKEMLNRDIHSALTPSRYESGRKPVLKYRIPMVEPIQFTHKELPIEPYLLGIMIGDGSLTGSVVAISNPDEDRFIIEKAKGLIDNDYYLRERTEPQCPQFIVCQKDKNTKSGYIRKVKALGLNVHSPEKFIPSQYMMGDVEQRLELLRGLMDTDGTFTGSCAMFNTTSKKLAVDVAKLTQSLGGVAYIKSYDRTDEGKSVEYAVVVKTEMCPFSLPRKAERWHKPKAISRHIESIDYAGETECVCIYVSNDDHLYVTDNYIVTHNTAVMLQMARVAAANNIPAVVFTLEMTNNELVQRMACTSEELNIYDLNMGRVQWPVFDRAMARFSDCPLWFNDKLSSFGEIINEITVMSRKGQCGIAFIDYLGLISHPGDMRPPYQIVTETTKRLKRLAKECNIPIVLLCQLNRDMSRDGREPQLHDLRDSGSIEQDADIVLMLSRATQDPDRYTELMMFVRKNRQGGIGDIPLRASRNLTSFVEDGERVLVGSVEETEKEEIRMPYPVEGDSEFDNQF